VSSPFNVSRKSSGMVTRARFGGYDLFLSKGIVGIRHGKPLFLYNLLDLKRTVWALELKAS
jgi:hypothetical protein